MKNTTFEQRGDASRRRVARLASVGVCLLGIACAGPPRAQLETPARLKDSAPEKIAALRAASGDLHLEEEDDRWGIEMARARRIHKDPQAPDPASAPAPPAKVLEVHPSPTLPSPPLPATGDQD